MKEQNLENTTEQPNEPDVQIDCPYDVEIYGEHGTCQCGGLNYDECLGDI